MVRAALRRARRPAGASLRRPRPGAARRDRAVRGRRPARRGEPKDERERPDGAGAGVVRPHDLRHTCASLHIKAGTPPKVLSAMLGHASVSITLDRYGHLYPGDVHQYVDRLGELAIAARADWVRTGAGDRLVALPLAVAGESL